MLKSFHYQYYLYRIFTTMLVFGIQIDFLCVERQRNSETHWIPQFPFKYMSQIYISSNSEINSNFELCCCCVWSQTLHSPQVNQETRKCRKFTSFLVPTSTLARHQYRTGCSATSSNQDHVITYQLLALAMSYIEQAV